MQLPPSEQPLRAEYFSRRVRIAKYGLYGFLTILGPLYLLLLLFSDAGIWLPALQLLLAMILVAVAFVENALRCLENRLTTPKAMTEASWLKMLPPNVLAWWRDFQQNQATTTFMALLAVFFAVGNLADTPTITSVDVIISRFVPGILIVLSFGLLIIERMLSFTPTRRWPFQPEYIGLARVMLSLLLLLAAALLTASWSPAIALWLIKLATVLVLLMALEYLLRAIAALATLHPSPESPRFLTRSVIAAQYRWPLRPLASLLDMLEQRFGIDIRQIQAFRLIKKTLLPVICGIAVLGWAFSGLTEVPLNQRGIYALFGRPVAVLPPGLHVGSPWPFGRVSAVENGEVHELQLGDTKSQENADEQPDSAEGPAPQSSWRLWDNSHTTDSSQVIASKAADSQSFQIVNMDIRLIWRVGLHDDDALNSLYQVEALPTLIRRIARQVLVTQFASKQLDELLNEQRASLSAALTRQIQQRLTALHTGVELLSTRIEAIHPPAGAADAYHGVQAAQIAASARVARERGYAATVTTRARQKAETDINDAQAFAAENLSRAHAAAATFTAERQAWQQAKAAFLLERRYRILSQSLAHTPLLILDNHLQGANEPVLDLREYPAFDSTAPQKARAK